MISFNREQLNNLIERTINLYLDKVDSDVGGVTALDQVKEEIATALYHEYVTFMENGAYPNLESQTFITAPLTELLLGNPANILLTFHGCAGHGGDDEPHIHAELHYMEPGDPAPRVVARSTAESMDVALSSLSLGAWANYHFGPELPADAPDWLRKMYRPKEQPEPEEPPIIRRAKRPRGIMIVDPRKNYRNN